MSIEMARFLPDDPDPLVQASFACPHCLHQPTEAVIDESSEAAIVDCTCEPCGCLYSIALTEEQTLRLALREPWADAHTIVHRA